MMKRAGLCLLFTLCLPIVFAGYSDGYLTADDGYQGYITWRSYSPPLMGALGITVRDSGYLIMQSTSAPLEMLVGGVYDIALGNSGQLLFLGGETELITIGNNATAVLKGGSINLIKSMQFTTETNSDPHIDLYCRLDSWSWISDDPLLGIQGLWLDGTPFHIEFINDFDYDPVWTNLNIIPEPTTLALLGLGGLLIRTKK